LSEAVTGKRWRERGRETVGRIKQEGGEGGIKEGSEKGKRRGEGRGGERKVVAPAPAPRSASVTRKKKKNKLDTRDEHANALRNKPKTK